MTHHALTPLLGHEFDPFLFASVGEERNGMPLSVLSALSRLDVDPWELAVALSRMPKEKAKDRLAALIAPLTAVLETNPSSDVVAGRLIALLPNAPSFVAPSPVNIAMAARARPSRYIIALCVVAVVLAAYFAFFNYRPSGVGVRPAATTSESNPTR